MLKTTLTVTALAAALTLAAGSEKPLVDLENYDISKIQVIDFGPPLWVTPAPPPPTVPWAPRPA